MSQDAKIDKLIELTNAFRLAMLQFTNPADHPTVDGSAVDAARKAVVDYVRANPGAVPHPQ